MGGEEVGTREWREGWLVGIEVVERERERERANSVQEYLLSGVWALNP